MSEVGDTGYTDDMGDIGQAGEAYVTDDHDTTGDNQEISDRDHRDGNHGYRHSGDSKGLAHDADEVGILTYTGERTHAKHRTSVVLCNKQSRTMRAMSIIM